MTTDHSKLVGSSAQTVEGQWFDIFMAAYKADEAVRHAREQARLREPFIRWEDVRAKLRCSDAVWQRIRRLNPDHRGIKGGEMLRGYHRSHQFSRSFHLDVITPKRFIEKFGRDAYRAVPHSAFSRNGHRKAIKSTYVQDAALLALKDRTP